MNPNNPNFRTNDEWFDLCGHLTQERDEAVAFSIRETQRKIAAWTERDELKAELAKWTSEPIPIALMKCNQRNENYLDDIDTLRKQLVVAVEALKHGYMLDDGKAYIRSKGNVPMEMNAKSERIVRQALAALDGVSK